jgi:uncharacterized protein YifE (UPF0438 family)
MHNFQYKPQFYRPMRQLDFHHISLAAFPDKKKLFFPGFIGSTDFTITESNIHETYIYIYIFNSNG